MCVYSVIWLENVHLIIVSTDSVSGKMFTIRVVKCFVNCNKMKINFFYSILLYFSSTAALFITMSLILL